MNLKSLQKNTYANTINLGYKVNKITTCDKLNEELTEFETAKHGDIKKAYQLSYVKDDKEFKRIFETHIKGTELDEIPDMIFVMLSYCEEHNIDFETLAKIKNRYNKLRDKQCTLKNMQGKK